MNTSKRLAVLLFLWMAATACLAQVDAFQKDVAPADVKAMEQGRALRQKGRFQDAINELNPVARRRPDYFNAQYELGLALASRGDSTDEGIATLEKAAALKRSHAEVTDAHIFNSLGWAYMYSGKPKPAEAAFKEAEAHADQLSPDGKRRLYNNMGYLYLTRGRLHESEKYLKLAAEKFDSPQAKANLRTLDYMKKQESK